MFKKRRNEWDNDKNEESNIGMTVDLSRHSC